MILFAAGFATCFVLFMLAGVLRLKITRQGAPIGTDDDVRLSENVVIKLGSQESSRPH